ncbi:hypothetical protein A5640_14995 [Mycobacterium asiaticum]|uniref:4Fe-4S Wbl-type domain-containing protein n=2 Tax=Mycobacterium asiaticum TaxID=1790 RepID=A0A1A3KK15_MYCAS|nr:hypothetical protein A5640_14995 [Mycobacterium asiaticum]
MRTEVRVFHTEQDLPCTEDPELFFDLYQKRRAISRCQECPFRGRCGYNAVALGATHGVWGGVMLPGRYPPKLQRTYVRLVEQFEQRRADELGDAAVGPLPDLLAITGQDEDYPDTESRGAA